MKVTIEYDLELEGDLDEKRAADIFFDRLEPDNVITSEDVGDTDGDWAILVNSWEMQR